MRRQRSHKRRAMSAGDAISANISGNISGGQVAVGKDIAQNQTVGTSRSPTRSSRSCAPRSASWRRRSKRKAPPERRAAAVERVAELEQAVLADEPDVTTIQYIGRWFRNNLPQLAGAVASIVVHPIVGKLVGAAGDALVAEFSS